MASCWKIFDYYNKDFNLLYYNMELSLWIVFLVYLSLQKHLLVLYLCKSRLLKHPIFKVRLRESSITLMLFFLWAYMTVFSDHTYSLVVRLILT